MPRYAAQLVETGLHEVDRQGREPEVLRLLLTGAQKVAHEGRQGPPLVGREPPHRLDRNNHVAVARDGVGTGVVVGVDAVQVLGEVGVDFRLRESHRHISRGWLDVIATGVQDACDRESRTLGVGVLDVGDGTLAVRSGDIVGDTA